MASTPADILFALLLHFFLNLNALLEEVVDLATTSGVGRMFIIVHHVCYFCSKLPQLFDDHDFDNRELAGFEFAVLQADLFNLLIESSQILGIAW